MASNKIGDVQFDLIERTPYPPLPAEMYHQSARAGIDYETTVGEGKRSGRVAWSGLYKWLASAAAARTFALSVADLRDSTEMLDVYDAHELSYDDVLVLEVGPIELRTVIKDGDTKFQVAVESVTLGRMR